MTYEELHRRFLARTASWFAVDQIYGHYLHSLPYGADFPIRWLVDVQHKTPLMAEADPMYRLEVNIRGDLVISDIPVTIGRFDFGIAAVVRSPYHCRIGDFVEPGSLPLRFGDRDVVYLRFAELPHNVPPEGNLPSQPAPTLVYHERRFFDGAGKVFALWRRES